MTRHGMGTIGCRTLSVKSKSGVSLTENNILPGGYWTPDVLESDGDFVEELNKLLVGIPPGSSVIFSVPIMPYLRNEPWDVTQVGSVSPRISYVKADGTDGEATGPLFRMIEPRAKQ